MHWKTHIFMHLRLFQSFSHKCSRTPDIIFFGGIQVLVHFNIKSHIEANQFNLFFSIPRLGACTSTVGCWMRMVVSVARIWYVSGSASRPSSSWPGIGSCPCSRTPPASRRTLYASWGFPSPCSLTSEADALQAAAPCMIWIGSMQSQTMDVN